MTNPAAVELCRSLAVAKIPPGGLEQTVVADDAECGAIAARMGIPSVQSLSCRFRLSAGVGGDVLAEGLLLAQVTRICVASLDDFATDVVEAFTLRFVPAADADADVPEVEVDATTVDEVPYQGGRIDLGEAAVEQLALALEPYPRKPGAALPDAGEEAAATPFAALAAWKPPRV